MADNTAASRDPLADITAIQAAFTNGDRAAKYQKYRDYYEGEQALEFATKKFQNAFGAMFQTFAYNRSAAVVDSVADRLQLLGFEVESNDTQLDDTGAGGQGDATALAIGAIWQFNRMDRLQGEVHTEALKCGDSYVIIWPELQLDGSWMPRIYAQKAGTVVVVTDEETGQTIYAAKAWKIGTGPLTGFWRLTMYFPEAIYKFVTAAKKNDMPKKAGDWLPYDGSVEGKAPEPWPIPNPWLTVPVFHFANNAFTGEYGRSELKDVIPLQDAVNKASMDLMVAMEYGAYRQRYATGLQLGTPDPITGVIKSPFKAGPGEIWTGPAGASFGDFDNTDLNQFLAVAKDLDAKISNVTRIPGFWLTMGMENPPSGEALKTADSPFVSKLEDRQISFGNPWEDIFGLGVGMMAPSGSPDGIVKNLKSVWKPAELRSDLDLAQVETLKANLGIPDEKLWAEMGYTAAEIEEMKAMKAEAVAEAQQSLTQGGLVPFEGDSEDGQAEES